MSGSRSSSAQRRARNRSRRCLFCRGHDGGFLSREHVFPESLGNTDLVLPPGVVCDRCNNTVLSQIDSALCDFPAVVLRRTMLGIPSKSGRLPVSRMSGFTMTHIPGVGGQDPTLRFDSGGPQGIIQETETLPDGRVRLEWSGTGGRRLTPRYASEISRALLKVALECAWRDDPARANSSKLNHVRAAVLGEPRDGFIVIARQADPNNVSASLTYQILDQDERTSRMLVFANLFGIRMATDSRLARPVDFHPAMPMELRYFRQEDSAPTRRSA